MAYGLTQDSLVSGASGRQQPLFLTPDETMLGLPSVASWQHTVFSGLARRASTPGCDHLDLQLPIFTFTHTCIRTGLGLKDGGPNNVIAGRTES